MSTNTSRFGEPVDGLLRQRRGAEDRALVGFEHVEPACDIRRMVGARLKGDAEVGTEESGTDFGNEFFAGIGVITEAFTEIAVSAMLWRRPVHQFMEQGGIVAFGRACRQRINELAIRRHFDAVG